MLEPAASCDARNIQYSRRPRQKAGCRSYVLFQTFILAATMRSGTDADSLARIPARECDPDLCKACAATCHGEALTDGNGMECYNMKLRLHQVGDEAFRCNLSSCLTTCPPDAGLSCASSHIHAHSVAQAADHGVCLRAW